MWARLERQRCLVKHIEKSLLKCQFIANSKYRRRGSLKESNKRLNNKNFTHKFYVKMTSETPFEQTTELVSEPGNELNTVPWKTRRNDIVHTNLLALKLHRKITSFLVDIQAETAAQNATENASPDSHMRQWSDQVNQYRTTSNLHMKLTHLKTIHGHNQMCKRRNQAAVTASPIKRHLFYP